MDVICSLTSSLLLCLWSQLLDFFRQPLDAQLFLVYLSPLISVHFYVITFIVYHSFTHSLLHSFAPSLLHSFAPSLIRSSLKIYFFRNFFTLVISSFLPD